MAIRDLLVAYDGNDASKKATQFAVNMARKYDASITGVHVFRPETYESHIRRWIPENVLASMHKAEQEVESSIEQSFRETVAETGFAGETKWITAEGQPSIMLPRIARYFDILLVGQFTTHFTSDRRTVSPDDLSLRSGVPLIIVPKDHEIRPFREEAAIAWDGSRSAARALTDAMQILETKKRLDVVTAGKSTDLGRVPEGVDVVDHLVRHGIKAKHVYLDTGHSPGESILEYCREVGPDLLVMGAYGRGKLGSMLFGSVTRHVLQNMNVPVLISH